jgi:uncharacterized protein (DUF885 family)
MTSDVFALAEEYLERAVELDPILGTELGRGQNRGGLPDFSPEGCAARAELARETLRHASRLECASHEAIGRDLICERLEATLGLHDAGEWLRHLDVISSPQHQIKEGLDLMEVTSDEDWELVAERLSRVPSALAGYRTTLVEGLARGIVAARRQAEAAARQAEETAAGYFTNLVARYGRDGALHARLDREAKGAAAAYHELAMFLRSTYAPKASPRDGVGQERWERFCRRANGIVFAPREAYEWGIEELRRILAEMDREGGRILQGATRSELFAHLDADASLTLKGEEVLRAWNQEQMDHAIAALQGTHFDIPAPLTKVEAMIAPPGGAAAMYYTGPSEDLTRPGRTWYPTLGRKTFPVWHELSTVYHEGVPGHHLQVGYAVWMGERLNAFQRSLGWVSGHGEGWALYAERLMDELGFFEDPRFRVGFLSSQAFRAARVVIDIGLHLELPALDPDLRPLASPWQADAALAFLKATAGIEQGFAVSEIDRYLGWPAQATSYKLGERAWLQLRDEVRRRQGAAFEQKQFHMRALGLGNVGLAQLEAAFATQ